MRGAVKIERKFLLFVKRERKKNQGSMQQKYLGRDAKERLNVLLFLERKNAMQSEIQKERKGNLTRLDSIALN